MKPTANESPEASEPLEYFEFGRRIRRGLSECSRLAAEETGGDVFYLWLKMGPSDGLGGPVLTQDHWLNIIDEAASMGVNWLVVTLGDPESRAYVPAMCLWAQETHGMVVCLHAPAGVLGPAEREALAQLPPESSYLLVEPEHRDAFSDLERAGVDIAVAAPAKPGVKEPCDFPNKMIFVDAQGHLYTCGLVSGDSEFFLGSVFDGSLDEIIHNPKLPHTVSDAEPSAHRSCSGCPPLVAKYLCQR